MTSAGPVCAVLAGTARGGEILEAVRAQSRPVDETIVAGEAAKMPAGVRVVEVAASAGMAGAARAGLQAALAGAADWLWLLDGSAVPGLDALEHLLAVLDDLGDLPAPALLAGTVVAADGEPHPAALPLNRLTRKEVAIEACRRHLVAIRAARHGSLLVSRAALQADGLPRADYVTGGDDLEWTARLLRDADGYLVPASTALRAITPPAGPSPAVPTFRGVRNDVDMLRGPAWGGEEKLWVGFLVASDLARGLRAHPWAVGRVARGAWAGLRSRA